MEIPLTIWSHIHVQNREIKLLDDRISLLFRQNIFLTQDGHAIKDDQFGLGRTVGDDRSAHQNLFVGLQGNLKGHGTLCQKDAVA